MRKTTELINENNDKRQLLNAQNEKIYEDLLLYIRTDLRVSEHAAEELLMDLLDHLIEAQEKGKDAQGLFGDSPKAYADELIANMPTENKRNWLVLFTTFVLGLAGWFVLTFGILNGILSLFTPVNNEFSLGSVSLILLSGLVVGFIGILIIFSILRASVFNSETKEWKIYILSGIFGMIGFAIILGVGFFFDEIGPVVHIQWWILLIIGLLLLSINKAIGKFSTDE